MALVVPPPSLCSAAANRRPGGSRSKTRRFVVLAATTDLQVAVPSQGELHLIDSLVGVGGRGRVVSSTQLQAIADAVAVLESEGGVEAPTGSSLIEGLWRLMYTTRPSSASPIQRTFVGVDAFTVYQEIKLSNTDDPRVSNIVKFSKKIGELKVEASASVEDSRRINFKFDRAAFSFTFLPFKVPYPVPFRLLGDEAKGWLDTTYLSPSGNIRISRGNKGTTFVLQKCLDARQRLLSAISSGQGVEEAIQELVRTNPTKSPADLGVLAGKWRLLWSSQAENANWLQKISSRFSSWQIIEDQTGKLQNLVEFLPGLKLRATAVSEASSNTRRDVQIKGASLQLLSLSVPLNITGTGFVDLLYLDNKLRISKGNKGTIFVHAREQDCD